MDIWHIYQFFCGVTGGFNVANVKHLKAKSNCSRSHQEAKASKPRWQELRLGLQSQPPKPARRQGLGVLLAEGRQHLAQQQHEALLQQAASLHRLLQQLFTMKHIRPLTGHERALPMLRQQIICAGKQGNDVPWLNKA